MDNTNPIINSPDSRPVAAVIGVVFHEKQVLLVRRANPPDGGCWGLPGGKIHMGESISEAVVREIHEETSVSVAAKRVFTAVDAFDVRKDNRLHQHFILVAVLCEWLAGEPLAGDDALEARWFCPEELNVESLAVSLDVQEVIALAKN